MIHWNLKYYRNKYAREIKAFKEDKLPLVIIAIAAIIILIFIIGSISNATKRNRAAEASAATVTQQTQAEKEALDYQVSTLLAQAEGAAAQYDYSGALQILEPVSQYENEYPELAQATSNYKKEMDSLVAWSDPSQIPNLSFQMLIADPNVAFNDNIYGKDSSGNQFNKNFVTTEEFSAIIQQLYDNNYVLVNLKDVYTTQPAEDGVTANIANTIYLPAGKKPLIITQTNVNYPDYLIGRGFASKLLIENNQPVCEMTDSEGNITTGQYDLIPILESFIAEHPDFSYQGARAVIALTGQDGLFGYRDASQASDVANWLRNNGYELACYTYSNMAYGTSDFSSVRTDLQSWSTEIEPVLGKLDILVYAQRSDAGDAGAIFELLLEQGFTYYLGFSENGAPSSNVTTQYVRQGRIMVTGSTMKHHSGWFTQMFNASTVLDPDRGSIPVW